MATKERECFVISPFGEHFDRLFKSCIKKVLEKECKIVCSRSDTPKSSTVIVEDIYKKIAQAKFIIADLTNLNPNVLYELGIAHTMGKRVVMISQDVEKLPFDISAIRVLKYDDHISEGKKFIKKLKEAIEEISREEWINNPVVRYLPNSAFRYLTHITELIEIERKSEDEIWIMTWDLVNDLEVYRETIINNLKDGKIYKYIMPDSAEEEMKKLQREIKKSGRELVNKIDWKYVKPSLLESTFVIYNPKKRGYEKVFILPSIPPEYNYGYEVNGPDKSRIIQRFLDLWQQTKTG